MDRRRGQKKINGYVFRYRASSGKDTLDVKKVANGKEKQILATVKLPKSFPGYGQSHDIRISVKGNQHVLQVDGETMMEFQDLVSFWDL